MFVVGLSQGPLHHYWYGYLDRLLPSRSLRTVGLKILADQGPYSVEKIGFLGLT